MSLGRKVLLSYPKSGRTWIRYILFLAGVEIEYSHAGCGMTSATMGRGFSGLELDSLGETNVFMYRNPLDTAVSLYFQVHKKEFCESSAGYQKKKACLESLQRPLPPKDIDEFVLEPIWGVGNVCKFNRGWLDYFEKNQNCLVLTYEAFVMDPSGSIKKLLEYLGCQDVDIDEIVEKSRFENMKKLELQGKNKELRLQGVRNGDMESMKVRKGLVKGYKAYLDDCTILRADEIARNYGFAI